jgi:hypothetical protein
MRKLPLGFLLFSVLSACLSQPGGLSPPGEPPTRFDSREHPWSKALRALDPADTTDPAHDLTAIYLRQAEDHLQIRVDLLDFQNANNLSLDIEIGDVSTPEAAPFNIHIPSEDSPASFTLDPLLATVIVDLPRSAIPSHPRVSVSTPEDEISGLTLAGPLPAQAAPLLLTFYDTFAGRFPAEALRRWDGAHSGPRGERHGLKHLLEAAQEYQTPIVLLDLKKPENLSVLDAMGVLPQIEQLEKEGLLLLPDQAEQENLFGFSPSLFLWGGIPLRSTLASRPTFAYSSDPDHISRPLFSKTAFIPIAAATDSTQPTPDGPSLEVRRALLEAALNADEKDLLVLGGSLQETTWGSPDMAGATLAYFASRPYIHILTADDLMNFPTRSGKPELRPSPQDESISKLETHYKNLTQPVLDFAANWGGSPLSSCSTDIDKDNQPECVLADGEYLAILDPQGARLTYFFSVARNDREASPKGGNSRNVHQLIGPSWQVAVGLSNPSMWDLSAGEAADPGAYPGAFADADDPFKAYEPAIQGNTIVFTTLDGSRVKTFSLTGTGLEVAYQTQEPVITQIPLLADPGTRFTPGWAGNYVQENTPGGIAWGLGNGPMVSVQTRGLITMRAFNELLSLLANPEDPDFDYPPGHYVPFPMAIAEVEMQDGYFLRLERLP